MMDLQERLEQLKRDIEALRREIDGTSDEPGSLPQREEAARASHKLDQLIAEFLRVRERLVEAE
jgi:phage shock protein A